MHAHPARHRHQRLKHAEGACDLTHGVFAHFGVMQAVGHGHRKRIHGKAHAQKDAVEEKYKTPLHIVCLLKLTRIGNNTKPGSGTYLYVRNRVIF